MKPLALKPILSQLNEAYGALVRLFARMQFVVFGEVLDEGVKNLEASVALAEQRDPLTEEAVFVAISNAYRHLNMAWNFRHASEERISRCTPADCACWSKFPKDAFFRVLWPAPSRLRGKLREPGRKRYVKNSFEDALLHMAVRKLEVLRYKVSCALGDAAPEKVPRPKGLFPEVDAEPFTEATFRRRLRIIYHKMNDAWACHKGAAKSIVDLSRQAKDRRGQFPCAFLKIERFEEKWPKSTSQKGEANNEKNILETSKGEI